MDYSTSGLENALSHALLGLLLAACADPTDRRGAAFRRGMILALIGTTRLDLLVLAGPARARLAPPLAAHASVVRARALAARDVGGVRRSSTTACRSRTPPTRSSPPAFRNRSCCTRVSSTCSTRSTAIRSRCWSSSRRLPCSSRQPRSRSWIPGVALAALPRVRGAHRRRLHVGPLPDGPVLRGAHAAGASGLAAVRGACRQRPRWRCSRSALVRAGAAPAPAVRRLSRSRSR